MNDSKTIWFKIVISFIVIIILMSLHYVKLLQPVEGLITYMFKPMQAPIYKLSMQIFDPSILDEKTQLFEKNKSLSEKINTLTIENAQLQKNIEENKILAKQTDFLEEQKYKYEPARIIHKFSEDNAQIITINQGKNKGIEKNMMVIADEGIVIGKISNVEENTAKVLLITSNISQIAAQIENEQNSPGLVVGRHGLSLDMQLIPKQDEIQPGDLVITSGIEEKVPKGLVIGEIERIEDKSEDLFKTATVIPLIDYNRLAIVSVIIF